MNRPILLLLLLVAAGGYWLADNWGEVSEQLGIEQPIEMRALHIAKTAYCLRTDLPNEAAIEEHLRNLPDDTEPLGWRTQPYSDHIYLVRYDYRQDDELVTWLFEVDVGSTSVRSFDAEPELAEKYGNLVARSAPPAAAPPTAR